MRDIKAHSHKDREEVINKVVPQLKDEFKNNLMALAADGSFARNEDLKYSDLELIVFLKTIPNDFHWEIREITDGILLVVIAETKDSYIHKYLEVSDSWYASGGSKLSPILNNTLIQEINSFIPKDIEAKCLAQIKKRWLHFQEITAKLLNLIEQGDKQAVPLAFHNMVIALLILLSYLNQTPYITLGSYIKQAKTFKRKTPVIDKMLLIEEEGTYTDLEALGKITEEVFTDMEILVSL